MPDPTAELATALADRYAIEGELGEGGMATVYRAEDVKHRRQVAVKVLRPELAAVLGGERFLREIQISAQLNHPHILPLFDSGEANGFLYYVMPLMAGESLRDRIRKAKQLPIPDALEIAADVAAALDYAHRHGIVHRDIKPENIMLHEGSAVVADFGIGKAVSAAADSAEAITQTGMSVGTPAYMSPEQASGEHEVDGRSDLYSLGCVLYEMLAGEPPFTGPTAQAVIAKRFTMTPPAVTLTRTSVPAYLNGIVARLLERAPVDRYETASQVVKAFKSGESAAHVVSHASEKSIAVLPFANMSADPDNEYFSDGMTDEIITALTRLDDLHVASRTSSFSFKNTKEDLRAVGAKLQVRHILEGSVRRAGNRVRITVQMVDVGEDASVWSERFDREMDDIFAVQDEIAVTIAERLQASLRGAAPAELVPAATANIEAYEHYLRGLQLWHQRGGALFQAVEHFERAVTLDPNFVAPYAGLAVTYPFHGLYCQLPQSEARERALSAAEKALALAPDDPDCLYAGAVVDMYYTWDVRRAEARLRKALDTNPRHARAWAWLAQLLGILRRPAEARDAAERARELDPHSALIAAAAGSGVYLSDDPSSAIPFGVAGLALDPDHVVALLLRTWAELALGRPERGLPYAERAVEVAPNPFTLCFLCYTYAKVGRVDEARRAFARFEETPESHRTQYSVGIAHYALGEVDSAIESICASLRAREGFAWASTVMVSLGDLPRHPRIRAEMAAAGLEWVLDVWLRVDDQRPGD